jgi:hypothetical protein
MIEVKYEILPPILFIPPLRPKEKYLIFDGFWIKVPFKTKMKDIKSTKVSSNIIQPKAIVPQVQTWIIDGSKGNKYTVTLMNNSFSCTCPAYGFRRSCKHIDNIKNSLK